MYIYTPLTAFFWFLSLLFLSLSLALSLDFYSVGHDAGWYLDFRQHRRGDAEHAKFREAMSVTRNVTRLLFVRNFYGSLLTRAIRSYVCIIQSPRSSLK